MVQTISVRAKLVPFLEMDWKHRRGGFASRRAVHLGSERLDHPGEAFESLNIGLLGDGLQQRRRGFGRELARPAASICRAKAASVSPNCAEVGPLGP